MHSASVAEALSNVRRMAEAAHVTVARTSLSEGDDVDDVAKRLAAVARQLDAMQTRVLESTLRYQAVVPCLLPAVPSHIPEFLRTRKDPPMEAADAAAEHVGAALGATLPVGDANDRAAAMRTEFAAMTSAAIADMRAESAALLDAHRSAASGGIRNVRPAR